MQIDGIQTGGHKVDQLRWNSQLLYKRQIETLPFTTHVFNGSDVNSLEAEQEMDEAIYKPNKYLDFTGLWRDTNLDTGTWATYKRFRKTNNTNDPLFAGIRINTGFDSSWKGDIILYFKILIPEGESVQIDWNQGGVADQHSIGDLGNYDVKLYLFWSNCNLLGENRRSGLNYNYVKDGTTFTENAHMPINFKNTDSLFQYYRNQGIIHTPSFPKLEDYPIFEDITEWDASTGSIEPADYWFPIRDLRMVLKNTSNQTLPYYIYYSFCSNLNSGKSTDYYIAGFRDITITKLEDTE